MFGARDLSAEVDLPGRQTGNLRGSVVQQLESLGWTSIDQGPDIPHDPGKSLRQDFRQRLLPDVFFKAVTAINKTVEDKPWLTDKQLNDLHLLLHNLVVFERQINSYKHS